MNTDYMSPLPDSLEGCHKEIVRLRRQLLQANERWAKAVEKNHCDRKAAAGQIRAARVDYEFKRLSESIDRADIFQKLIEHFRPQLQQKLVEDMRRWLDHAGK